MRAVKLIALAVPACVSFANSILPTHAQQAGKPSTPHLTATDKLHLLRELAAVDPEVRTRLIARGDAAIEEFDARIVAVEVARQQLLDAAKRRRMTPHEGRPLQSIKAADGTEYIVYLSIIRHFPGGGARTEVGVKDNGREYQLSMQFDCRGHYSKALTGVGGFSPWAYAPRYSATGLISAIACDGAKELVR